MKIISQDIELQAEQALESCLSNVPFISIGAIRRQERKNDFDVDMTVEVSTPGRSPKVLVVEVKTSGEPRIAKASAAQLKLYLEGFRDAYGVFLAPYISERSASILENSTLGWLDLSGNCRLCFDEVYISKRGQPNLFSEKRALKSLFAGKAERILRVLLNDARREWKTLEMAAEARVSAGEVSKVRRILLDRELIRDSRRGIILTDPRSLLAEWSRNYNSRKNNSSDFFFVGEFADFESNLARVCRARGTNYGLTGLAAAVRLAPAVRYQKVTAYVDVIDRDLHNELNLKKVESGPNVTLLKPYDEGVFYGSRDYEGINIVSPVQVYLDLMSNKGRGEEAAEALLREVIAKSWPA